MSNIKALVFAGSTRKDSFNKKIARIAATLLEEEGVEVTFIDLMDYKMPFYDGDDEEISGLPDAAKQMKNLMVNHDALVIASPEYNSSISGTLKNTIDWVSRKENDDEPSLVAFQGKVAALLSASPGRLGGLRGLVHLRSILSNINVLVLPNQLSISEAYKAFDEKAALKDDKLHNVLKETMKKLAETTRKLKGNDDK